MTSRNKMTAGLAVIAMGTVLGATALRAQKSDDTGRNDPNKFFRVMGSPSDTWLGVELKDLTADQARDMKLGDDYGAMVEKVEKDSPAAKAGLETGDVLVEFNGEKVHSVAALRRMVDETPAGRSVEIRVRRNGEDKTLNATIDARNDGMEAPENLVSRLRGEVWPRVNVPVYDFSFGFGGPRLGVLVNELTPQLGAYFGVKNGKGVLVVAVNPGTAAEKAGIKAGDCIVRMDSTPIDSSNELHRALLRKQGESRDVAVVIVRDRKEQTVQVHLEPAPHPGPHVMSESGVALAPDAGEIEAQVREALTPDAEKLAAQADDLLESERGDIERETSAAAIAEAKRYAEQAAKLQQELLKEKGQWQQQLDQLGPEMKRFQQQMKDFQLQWNPDVI